MSTLRLPQNPGIDGLTSELTSAEILLVQNLTNLPYQNGDIIYYYDGAFQRLAIGTEGQALIVASGIPAWGEGSGGGGGHIIQDEGAPLTQRANLNFEGAGVNVTDDAGNDATIVTIPGGSLSFNLLRERLTGTQDGDDVVLDLTDLSQTYAAIINVFRLGVALNPTAPNAEYSKTGDEITIFNADASEVFLVEYTYSGGGVGNVAGPASSTLNNVAVYADTTGKVIKDSGVLYTNLLLASDIGVTVQGYDSNTTILGNTTTGTGSIVRATSPTLVTPALGTPTALVLTNATGTPSSIGLVNGTGLPISGLTPSTSTAIGVGSVELGHASDTTIARVSAGVISVEGVTIPSISSTNTLTNKRITKRTGTTTSSATPTINTDDVDEYYITAQATDITSFTTNLSGTPTLGQQLFISVIGTAARAITWGASFANGPVALPTTTVTTTQLSVLLKWDGSIWRCYATGSTV